MRCSHQDRTSSWPAKASTGEFTHPGAETTFKPCLLSALSHSSKDQGQEGIIKPHPVTNHTHLSQLSPHTLSLTGTVRPHNTSHSQGIHSSHLKISKCTVPAEKPVADAVCILNCQEAAKLRCIWILATVHL